MLANEASGRLLAFLGVELVDECDRDLEAAARAWLAAMPVISNESPSTVTVRRALERIDERRAA